jgi:RNA polymerase sigma-70 factor (ECF subfamily)
MPGMTQHPDRAEVQSEQSAKLRSWVLLMAGGDEAALGLLYGATLSRVYGLALRICGRRDLAEDVVVETFWQAWREATRFDAGRGEVLAWLLMMCRSRALDALRRKDDAESHPEPELLMMEQPEGSGSPLDQLLGAEQAGLVNAAMSSLTAIQRQLLALAFYKGLSHQEICDHTGLPLGTVKSHLKRAQDGLKTALRRSGEMNHG